MKINILLIALTNTASGVFFWFVMFLSLVLSAIFLNINSIKVIYIVLLRFAVMVLPVVVIVILLWKLLKIKPLYYLFGAILALIIAIIIIAPLPHMLTYISCIGKDKEVRNKGNMINTPVCVTSGYNDAGKPCSRPKDCLSGICIAPSEIEINKYMNTDLLVNNRNRYLNEYRLPEELKVGSCNGDDYDNFAYCRPDNKQKVYQDGTFRYPCLY